MSQVNQGFIPMVHTDAKPGRVHHLILGRSPAFYLSKLSPPMVVGLRPDQKEPPGKATAVNHAILVDEDTGALYGELYVRAEPFDLVGFLGRAWSKKETPSLAGVPLSMSIGDGVTRNPFLLGQVTRARDALRIDLAEPAFGYSIKTVARQQYEKRVNAFLARLEEVAGASPASHISNCMARAGEFSTGACLAGQDSIDAHASFKLSLEQVRVLDRLSARGYGWRTGVFSFVSIDDLTANAPINVPLLPSKNVAFTMPQRQNRTIVSGADIVRTPKKLTPAPVRLAAGQASLDLASGDEVKVRTEDDLTLYQFLDYKFQLTLHGFAISRIESLDWLKSKYGEPMVRDAIGVAANRYLQRRSGFGDPNKTREAFEKIVGICFNQYNRSHLFGASGIDITPPALRRPVLINAALLPPEILQRPARPSRSILPSGFAVAGKPTVVTKAGEARVSEAEAGRIAPNVEQPPEKATSTAAAAPEQPKPVSAQSTPPKQVDAPNSGVSAMPAVPNSTVAAAEAEAKPKSSPIFLVELRGAPKHSSGPQAKKDAKATSEPSKSAVVTNPLSDSDKVCDQIVAVMGRRMLQCDGYFMKAAATKLVQEGLSLGMMPEELMGLAEGAPGENWVAWRTEYIRLRAVFESQPSAIGLGSSMLPGRRWAN